MNVSKKAGLTASICHTERFSESGIPIYNSEFPDTAGRKTTIARTLATTKRYGFHADKLRLDLLFSYQ